MRDDLGTRQMIWQNTQAIVRDFPLVGTGLGTFTQVFPMHRSFHVRGLVTHAENDFLQLVSEVGIIGFGLVFVLFLILMVRAVSNIRSLSLTESQRYLGIGGLVGILALMCHSVVERNIQVPANAFLWTFLWAIILETGARKPIKIF
jgi:O-antigen ligase